jgi:hypothetical protein
LTANAAGIFFLLSRVCSLQAEEGLTMSEQRRGNKAAKYDRISRELASAAENLTSPVVAELTDAEISLVAGGAEAL